MSCVRLSRMFFSNVGLVCLISVWHCWCCARCHFLLPHSFFKVNPRIGVLFSHRISAYPKFGVRFFGYIRRGCSYGKNKLDKRSSAMGRTNDRQLWKNKLDKRSSAMEGTNLTNDRQLWKEQTWQTIVSYGKNKLDNRSSAIERTNLTSDRQLWKNKLDKRSSAMEGTNLTSDRQLWKNKLDKRSSAMGRTNLTIDRQL